MVGYQQYEGKREILNSYYILFCSNSYSIYVQNVIVRVLFVIAVQIQFTANAYTVYPALSIPKWFSEPFIDYAPISPAIILMLL
jgi:hypothetical protein